MKKLKKLVADGGMAKDRVLAAIAEDPSTGVDCLMLLNGAPASSLGNTQLAVEVIVGLMDSYARDRMSEVARLGLQWFPRYRANGWCPEMEQVREKLLAIASDPLPLSPSCATRRPRIAACARTSKGPTHEASE